MAGSGSWVRDLTKTNRNGEILTRTYDAAGRLATLTGPGSTESSATTPSVAWSTPAKATTSPSGSGTLPEW